MTLGESGDIYVYDGTLEGLLTIAFDSYVSKVIPCKIVEEKAYIPSFIEQPKFIKTDEQKARRIFEGIEKNISEETLYYVCKAFLSNDAKKEIHILKYILYGFLYGPKINTMLKEEFVFYVQALAKKVWIESHRFKGFVRFADYQNLLYSVIEPDNNIVEIVAHHFMRRLSQENFVIHDKKRNIAALYNKKELLIADFKDFVMPEISEEEKEYQKMWKAFVKVVAIEGRKNPKVQKQYMPKRYWKNMLETE